MPVHNLYRNGSDICGGMYLETRSLAKCKVINWGIRYQGITWYYMVRLIYRWVTHHLPTSCFTQARHHTQKNTRFVMFYIN